MTTIQISDDTRKKLALKKIHNNLKTYDEVIQYLLKGVKDGK